MSHPKSRHRRQRRGATLVLIAVLMVVLLGMVAFSFEIGRIYLVRAQLQSAVDAGALAASIQLREDPDDINAALAAANEFVQYNEVGWSVVVPQNAITAEAGKWDDAAKTFSTATSDPDAVRVFASVDDEPFFFAGHRQNKWVK